MLSPPSLRAFLSELCVFAAVPRPTDEPWDAMIQRIHQPGRVCEINEETYDWFLECLPPKWMGHGGFAFAEGAEPLMFFWRRQERCFVRQLSDEETQIFCRLARIPIPC